MASYASRSGTLCSICARHLTGVGETNNRRVPTIHSIPNQRTVPVKGILLTMK